MQQVGSVTDLSPMFAPRSVALIGASADAQSISARPLRLLRQHGFAGELYPVNPKYDELLGLRVYPSIGAVPAPVDLALVIVPAKVVATVLEECAAAGVRCAMVITSGFAESGSLGRDLQSQIADLVRRTGLRIGGPNSEGIYNPVHGLCATFSPAVDPEHGFQPPGVGGRTAIVSQSGGLAFALLNHAQDRGLSIGPVVSTGNEVDLTWADYVDYVLDLQETRVVLGFVESVRDIDRLVDVARKSARLNKPIVVAKIGRTEQGGRAAASHTASLVGSDAVYGGVFRQLGIMRVDDVDEMIDLAAYFSVAAPPAGRRIAILTASGGAGAWLADACATRRLSLPPPPAEVQDALRSFIPTYGSVANPVDITAQATLEGSFERALNRLTHSLAFDVVVAISTLVREERFFQTLPQLKQALDGASASLVYYSYTRASPKVLQVLSDLGVPCFSTPARTAGAVSAAVRYASFLQQIDSIAVLSGSTGATGAWPEPGGPLSEAGARAYLEPLRIPSPPERLATTADEAVSAFELLGGGTVALKVQSREVVHKTDVGGVKLGLSTADKVRSTFASIVHDVAAARPDAVIDGVLVQFMAPVGIETFVAARREPLVGPLVVVGFGGVDVEEVRDVAMRLAPVSYSEARAMLDGLRGAAILGGGRGRPQSDVEALAATIVRVSEMAVALPRSVRGVEINPLLVLPSGQGVLMLDAVVELEENTSFLTRADTHADVSHRPTS